MTTADSAADLMAARTQMAVSLGWHIVIACLGVGFPLLVLIAVYLTNDARRTGDQELTEWFRVRALAAGLVVGLVALGGIGVLRADAPRLFDGLTGRALPLVIASALFGAASLFLLVRRRLVAVRLTGALAVVAIIWGRGTVTEDRPLRERNTAGNCQMITTWPQGTDRRLRTLFMMECAG